jgi:hypothetical protein
MRLLALALQKRADPSNLEDYLQTFSGSTATWDISSPKSRDAQPETIQEFLLPHQPAQPPDRPLCGAVTGRRTAGFFSGAGAHGSFLSPLDDSGEVSLSCRVC